MSSPTPPTVKTIQQFFKEHHAFIFDQYETTRQRLKQILSEYAGDRQALTSKIHAYGNDEKLLAEFINFNPRIIFIEHKGGSSHAFQFLHRLRAKYPRALDLIIVFTSSELSQALVAKAAEEEVDAYLLRPYSLPILEQVLAETIELKLHPSPYEEAMTEGRLALTTGEREQARTLFTDARSLNKRPALALSFLAQMSAEELKIHLAEDQYVEGLYYNNLHFKSLRGLFDLFRSQQRYAEAYQLGKHIVKYFPMADDLLAEVIRLAIMTKNMSDMESFYQLFAQLEHKGESMIRHVCAGIFVCGKYFLDQGQEGREKALALFNDLLSAYDGKTLYLRSLVELFLERGEREMAEHYFTHFQVSDKFTIDYAVTELLLKLYRQELSGKEFIASSLRFINQNTNSLLLYRTILHQIKHHEDSQSSSHQQLVLNKAKELGLKVA